MEEAARQDVEHPVAVVVVDRGKVARRADEAEVVFEMYVLVHEREHTQDNSSCIDHFNYYFQFKYNFSVFLR